MILPDLPGILDGDANPGATTSGSPCWGRASSRIVPSPWPASTPMLSPPTRAWRGTLRPATGTMPPARPPSSPAASARTWETSVRRSERAGVSRRTHGGLNLAAWAGKLNDGIPDDRRLLRSTLMRWLADPDLAAPREPGALKTLPVEERDEWLAFWKEVDALIKRTAGI